MHDSRGARYSILFLTILFSLPGFGQLPNALDREKYQQIAVMDLDQNSLAKRNKNHKLPGIKDPFIANNYKCSFTPQNSGTWKFSGTHKIWQLKIRSKDAYGIALILSGIKLNDEERLYIYNTQNIQGPYTRRSIPWSGILPLSYLPGDEVLVEYQVPRHSAGGTFTIETVSHAYIDPFGTAEKKGQSGNRLADDDCYICLEGDSLELAKRSVVKIIAHREGGSLICTGTLINNTAENKRPYILTAQHCIDNETDANRSVFIFDFDDLCRQLSPSETHQFQGADFLASSFEHDFTLVELNHRPPLGYRPYYAGWNLSPSLPGDVLSVHHPKGWPKRISTSISEVTAADYAEDNTRAPNAFWNVKKWNTGITEGGSSGAPLFNAQYQVIGTLTGGSASCDYPYNDYFQKLSGSVQASPDLKQLLDPLGLNANAIAGLDPFKDLITQCNTLSNISVDEPLGLESYDAGTGYYSGYNSDGIVSYAEKFTVADSMMLTGASFSVGSINTNAPGGILVALHRADVNGLPGTILHETLVPYNTLINPSGYVEFYPYIKVKGTFFISYTLTYSVQDQFAMNQALWSSNKINSAYLKLSSGWVPMNQVSPQGAGTSFDIKVDVCEETSPLPTEESYTAEFFPNPATSAIISKLNFTLPERFTVQVFDLQGRQQPTGFQVVDNNIVVNVSTLAPGMYFIRISTARKVFMTRVVKDDE